MYGYLSYRSNNIKYEYNVDHVLSGTKIKCVENDLISIQPDDKRLQKFI